MDVFEKLNRTFGSWYEGLLGGGGAAEDADLRPRDILRRILRAMEDGRREGLDGQVYVPNHFTLDIAVASDDERDYLRTFLDADDLAAAVRQRIEQHGYKLRGGLVFTINELPAAGENGQGGGRPGNGRVSVRCRFDPTAAPEPRAVAAPVAAASPPQAPRPLTAAPPRATPSPVTPAAAAHGARSFSAPGVAGEHRNEQHDEHDPGTVVAGALGLLTVYPADGGSAEVVPLTARGAQIGRSRQAGNDVVVAGDGMVSKRHARIEVAGDGSGRWVVRDLGSTNGTFVNERPVPAGDLYPLGSGDEVRVGATRITFTQTGNVAGGTVAAAAAPAPNRPAAAAPRLVAENGTAFTLASEMIVGRALTSDIMLPDPGVSARHARLTLQNGGAAQVFVEDLDSSGGTFVNNERIPARFAVVLYAGDQVRFGQAAPLRLEQPGSGGAAFP